jgi:response regulator RpfG family c-di-GMP phosphodiesterase
MNDYMEKIQAANTMAVNNITAGYQKLKDDYVQFLSSGVDAIDVEFEFLAALQRLAYLASVQIESYEYGLRAVEILSDPKASQVIDAIYIKFARTHRILALSANYYEDYDKALSHARIAYDYAFDSHDGNMIAMSLVSLAMVYSSIGNHAMQLELYEKAIHYCQCEDELRKMALLNNNVAYASMKTGDLQKANKYIQRALTVLKTEEKDWLGMADILCTAGDIQLSEKNYPEAKQYYEEGYKYATEYNNFVALVEANYKLAIINQYLGHVEQVDVYVKAAIELVETYHLDNQQRLIHESLSQMFEEVEDFQSAYMHLKAYDELKDKAIKATANWKSLVKGLEDELGIIKREAQITKQKSEYLERELSKNIRELLLTQDVTIQIMAILTETRDADTGNHIYRTMMYTKTLVELMKKDEKLRGFVTHDMEQYLHKSAQLHDIGKVGIPDSILLKPSVLTHDEFEVMKLHVLYGKKALRIAEKTLKNSAFIRYAREIAGSHHERWDGTGYPEGLSGEEIPISARIMAIADVYDALVTERPYKEAFKHNDAVDIMRSEKGTHFDPDLVELFLTNHAIFNEIAVEFGDSKTPMFAVD